MTTEQAIELLRPVAESRAARINLWSWRGWSKSDKRRALLRERATTEMQMIRSAQECGVLPVWLVPIIWRIVYSAAWAAIKYWVNAIHERDGIE